MNVPIAVQPAVPIGQGYDELLIAPSIEKRRLQCYLAIILGDIFSILLGFSLAGYIYVGSQGWEEAFIYGQLVVPIFLTIGLYNGAYSISTLKRASVGIFRALTALWLSSGSFIFLAFFAKSSDELSRIMMLGGVVVATLLVSWTRLQMRGFIAWRCGKNVMNEVVIDDGGPAIDVAGAIHVSASKLQLVPNLNDPHALDRIGLVLRNIDRVIVSCPPERRHDWAMMLKGANIFGEVLDDEVMRLGAQGARVADNHGMLLVSAGPLGLRSRATKRLFDLVMASAALIVLSPLLLLVALAIKLEDGGPILFVQRRMGRGNCFFDIFKFRSMSVSQCDSDGQVSASKEDQRITRIGRIMRSTSIDELPQLFNVLAGNMSIVGPRPHAIGSQAGSKLFWEVDRRYWQRHSLKPGLSGLAQIRGYRGATDHENDLVRRLQSDLEYLEGWTIWRDVKIILKTMRVLVHDRAF